MPSRVVPLSELDATFVRVRMEPAPDYIGRKQPDGTTQWGGFPSPVVYSVPHRLGAHGLKFSCPDDKSDGHKHEIFFEGEDVPGGLGTNHQGSEVRWSVESGEFVDTLTLSPSIQTHGAACKWHAHIRNGALEID